MTDHQNYSDSATAKLAGAATAPVFIATHASEGLPSSDAAGTGAVQRSSAGSASARAVDVIQCVLIERPEIGKAEAIRIIEALRSANLHVTGNAAQTEKVPDLLATTLSAAGRAITIDCNSLELRDEIYDWLMEKASTLYANPPAAPVETPPRAWLEAKAEVDAGWPERSSAGTSEDGLARFATEWANSIGFYDPREADDLAEKVIEETPIVARLMPVHSHSSAATGDAWPPLKMALWSVLIAENLNDGHYIKAFDLIEKLHAAAAPCVDSDLADLRCLVATYAKEANEAKAALTAAEPQAAPTREVLTALIRSKAKVSGHVAWEGGYYYLSNAEEIADAILALSRPQSKCDGGAE